jgi:hypothetical protein
LKNKKGTGFARAFAVLAALSLHSRTATNLVLTGKASVLTLLAPSHKNEHKLGINRGEFV